MANKIKLARGTKANIEANKSSLLDYEIVYSTDGKEIGVKNSDGTITYFLNKEHTVTPATKTKITYNEQGLVTGGADLAPADLPSDIPQAKIEGLTASLGTKLNKDFSSLATQPTPTFDDYVVINRATTAQRVTVGNLLALVDTGIFITVSALPTTGVANKIYLVPSDDPETQNVLDEYIWVNNNWEKIGAVKVDLSNYFNKPEINSLLDEKVDKNPNITAGTHPKITYDKKGLVTGGEALVADDIPNLNASKINAGTFAADRIPNLNASKINAGVLGVARIPDLAISKITNLQATLDTKLDADSIIDGGDIS